MKFWRYLSQDLWKRCQWRKLYFQQIHLKIKQAFLCQWRQGRLHVHVWQGYSTTVPLTVLMIRYMAVRHLFVSVVSWAFPVCVNIGRNFFSPAQDKLVAANRETVSKSNVDEELFVQTWTNSILKPIFAFSLSFTIFLQYYSIMTCFAWKEIKKMVHFCLTWVDMKCFSARITNKLYLVMYLAVKCEYIINLWKTKLFAQNISTNYFHSKVLFFQETLATDHLIS